MIYFVFSDTMGNKGAYINLDGKTLKPKFVTYEAVVRFVYWITFELIYTYMLRQYF